MANIHEILRGVIDNGGIAIREQETPISNKAPVEYGFKTASLEEVREVLGDSALQIEHRGGTVRVRFSGSESVASVVKTKWLEEGLEGGFYPERTLSIFERELEAGTGMFISIRPGHQLPALPGSQAVFIFPSPQGKE